MKFGKFIAATAACGILGTTLALPVSALGPNGDDGYTYFSICMAMTKDEAKANGVLDENGKGVEDGTCPLKITIDKVYFDGEEVDFNLDATSLYWQAKELKYEIINHWNTKLGDAENTVFSVEPPEKTLDVVFTVEGMQSAVEGETYFAGGFATGGNDAGCYTTSIFGNKPDEAIPEGTQFRNVSVTGDGQYVVQVAFPGNEFTDVTASGSEPTDSKADSTADSESKADSSKADSSAADSKSSSTAAASSSKAAATTNGGTAGGTTSVAATTDNTASVDTGATAGLALAGLALAGAAVVVAKKRK